MFLRRFGRLIFSLLLVLAGCGDKTDIKVPDGQPSSASANVDGQPVTGDWLVTHSSSDPEQLNPVTSNDATASEVLAYIFETLLMRDPETLELKPYLAEQRPELSADKLTYTFQLRRDVRFQDGHALTAEDVLFSLKVIKCSLVNAPFLRVYYNSVVDARVDDQYTIHFVTREPYFLNESQLGGIPILPRHYYDPEDLLKKVGVADIAKEPAQLSTAVKTFADNFNRNYNRNPMGSGPYRFNDWKTGRTVELARNPEYWGNGKAGIDQVFLDRIRYRIINNADAALVTLKSGGLDTMDLTPVQHT